jgi:hypothetical protein
MSKGNRITQSYDREAFQRSGAAHLGNEPSCKKVLRGSSPSSGARQAAWDLEIIKHQPRDAVVAGLILSVRLQGVVGGAANNIALAQ